MRFVVLGLVALTVPFASGALAQSGAPSAPSVTISPTSGDLITPHTALATGLPADVAVLTILFDPTGNQTVNPTRTDALGSVHTSLQPPTGNWKPGIYRWVVALGDGRSFSATFVASDGSPHLLVEPDQPSPTSALNIVGIGFPPNSFVSLILFLTGAGGQHSLQPKTDNTGAFSLYLFPQQFGFPFFSAGNYKLTTADSQLTTNFMVREHPVSSAVGVEDGVFPNGLTNLLFQHYPAKHYIWGIYADMGGNVVGEFLLGQTDMTGSLEVAFHFPSELNPGQYLLATPYDWGETSFTVDPRPTSTPTPTLTPTAKPVPKHKVLCKKQKRGSRVKANTKKCSKRKKAGEAPN
jgi:hypothetical protein